MTCCCVCSWYHGSISRRNAEQLLRIRREGSYLVRTSESNKLDYSLSVRSDAYLWSIFDLIYFNNLFYSVNKETKEQQILLVDNISCAAT